MGGGGREVNCLGTPERQGEEDGVQKEEHTNWSFGRFPELRMSSLHSLHEGRHPRSKGQQLV